MLRRFTKPAIAVTCAAALAAGVYCSRHDPDLPNPRLTPGEVLTTDLEKIKEPGYSATVRNVPWSVKAKVAANYGWSEAALRKAEAERSIEVDHLCPLALGGSNDERNLWIQPGSGKWNYHVKDALEQHLLAIVRRGEIDPKTAQREMCENWIKCYQRRISKEPLTHHANSKADPEP